MWLLLRPFLPWIIMAVVVGGGWVWADQRCNSACKREVTAHETTQKKLALEVASRQAADRRASGLQVAFDALAKRSATQLQVAQEKHNAQLARLDVQIKGLRARNTTLSADLVRVWQLASESANQAAGNGPAAEGNNGPPAEVSRPSEAGSIVTVNELGLAVFVRDAGAAYGSCSIKLRGCINAYNDAREAQLRSQSEP